MLPPQTENQSAKAKKTYEAKSYQHDYLERSKSHAKSLMFLDDIRLISEGDHLFSFLVTDLGYDSECLDIFQILTTDSHFSISFLLSREIDREKGVGRCMLYRAKRIQTLHSLVCCCRINLIGDLLFLYRLVWSAD